MSLLKKLLLVVFIILIYFTGIRKVRGVAHDVHLGYLLPQESGVINENLSFSSFSSVSFTFNYQSNMREFTLEYKIPFGAFFLFSAIGLVLIGATKNEYLILTAIHFTSGLVSLICLLIGINMYHYFLIVPDILSRYLVPLCSLGLVALAYLKKTGRLE